MADDGSLSSSFSQLPRSSTSSLSTSKLCSQTYKTASQLFLTRRLQESLSALEPVFSTLVSREDDCFTNGDDTSAPLAPIAAASSTLRIKIWNLYITMLNAVVDLGPDEGKKVLGQKEWKALVSKVRDGDIWETIVQTGYKGLEGSVDADVVYNLLV
jgi:solute carrier family 10 (sodium/bile acid cotransporter), member 7